jgi:hypothetical protein
MEYPVLKTPTQLHEVGSGKFAKKKKRWGLGREFLGRLLLFLILESRLGGETLPLHQAYPMLEPLKEHKTGILKHLSHFNFHSFFL